MRQINLCLAIAMCCASSELRADWNSTISTSNPLNWYRLDELTGSTAFDYGSQELHGTYGSGVNAPTRGVPGLVGTAVEFDGDRDNIVLNGSTLTGNWSAEFILKKTGTKFSAELLRGAALQFPSTHLKLEQYPNTGEVGYTQSFVADHTFSPPVVAPIGDFIQLVYVKSATDVKAYVNGVFAGSNNTTISLSRYQFGDTETESPFAVVDEIVVYNRSLSALEIADHYSAIPEPGSIILAGSALLCLIVARGFARGRF